MDSTRRTFILGSSALVLLGAPAIAVAKRPAKQSVPSGYVRIAIENGIPPRVLFAVALQESKRPFHTLKGRRTLPWPWTLNVQKTPFVFDTRREAERSLIGFLDRGIRSIDIGAMQVNWKWHHQRLGSEKKALEPYWNLRVGASILRDQFDQTRDWYSAVGRYHHPSDPMRAKRYADSVFRIMGGIADA